MECIISIFILLHNSADQLINASISDLFNIPDTKFQNKFQNITVWCTFVQIHSQDVSHIHVPICKLQLTVPILSQLHLNYL